MSNPLDRIGSAGSPKSFTLPAEDYFCPYGGHTYTKFTPGVFSKETRTGKAEFILSAIKVITYCTIIIPLIILAIRYGSQKRTFGSKRKVIILNDVSTYTQIAKGSFAYLYSVAKKTGEASQQVLKCARGGTNSLSAQKQLANEVLILQRMHDDDDLSKATKAMLPPKPAAIAGDLSTGRVTAALVEQYDIDLHKHALNLKTKESYKPLQALSLNNAKKLLAALADLQKQGYRHGDIKPENFLIKRGSRDRGLRSIDSVVFADFGGAQNFKEMKVLFFKEPKKNFSMLINAFTRGYIPDCFEEKMKGFYEKNNWESFQKGLIMQDTYALAYTIASVWDASTDSKAMRSLPQKGLELLRRAADPTQVFESNYPTARQLLNALNTKL